MGAESALMQYHIRRKKMAYNRFKELSIVRHSTDDKELLRKLMERDKDSYKMHKAFIIYLESIEV